MAIWSVSVNDAFKGELVKAKILELSIDMVALAHRCVWLVIIDTV